MAAEYPTEQPAMAQRPATTETRPARNLTGVRGTFGAVLLASFILILVGGIIAVVWALQLMDANIRTVDSIVGLVLGALTIFAGILVFQGRHEIGGIFAIVAGIVFLVLGPNNAGIFTVLGGILAVVANRVDDVVA
jgi:hypothetical protein